MQSGTTINWDEINAAFDPKKDYTKNFKTLPVGAYVCRILKVYGLKNRNDDVMLAFDVDIAEGEFAGYFKNKRDKWGGDWPSQGTIKRKLRDSNGGISANIFAILQCTEGVENGKFSPDKLVGKLCGFVFGEEEFEAKDGSKKSTVKIVAPEKISDIRAGKIEPPKLKKLADKPDAKEVENETKTASELAQKAEEVPDEDVPF